MRQKGQARNERDCEVTERSSMATATGEGDSDVGDRGEEVVG